MSSAHPAPTQHEVTSLTHDGRGVAHVGGKALFIAGALPGERVTVREFRKRRHFDEASVDSIEQASPERVTPQCAHFGICGGCSLQHLDPGAQIRAKQEHLLEEIITSKSEQVLSSLEPNDQLRAAHPLMGGRGLAGQG